MKKEDLKSLIEILTSIANDYEEQNDDYEISLAFDDAIEATKKLVENVGIQYSNLTKLFDEHMKKIDNLDEYVKEKANEIYKNFENIYIPNKFDTDYYNQSKETLKQYIKDNLNVCV